MIDSWDCCYHFLLVEAVRRHLSCGHDPVLSVLVSRETGVRLQSPSSFRPSNPVPYRARSNVWSSTIGEGLEGRQKMWRCWAHALRVAGRERPLMSTNVVSSCNVKNAYYISCLLHRLRQLCRRSLFCTAAVQVFSSVSLVFALHMIKIWNYKKRFLLKNRLKTTANPKMETVTALIKRQFIRHRSFK